MSEVDWSKAPEGAERYNHGNGYFYRQRDGILEFYSHGRDRWTTATTQDPDLYGGPWELRPVRAAWDGTGLPPAGTVFESLWSSSLGTYAESLAIGIDETGALVYKLLGTPSGERVGEFDTYRGGPSFDGLPDIRPLPTAEQLAAAERAIGISVLVRRFAIPGTGVDWAELFGQMIDCGVLDYKAAGV